MSREMRGASVDGPQNRCGFAVQNASEIFRQETWKLNIEN